MNTRYKLVNWEFDYVVWAQAVARIVEILGSYEDAGEYLGVRPKTIQNWSEGTLDQSFPYPHMTNFLKVINLIDERDTSQYWRLEATDD